MTDYGQAMVWRVPPGGGEPVVWLADNRLDGTDFGTTGIVLEAGGDSLLVAQGSSSGGGDGNPATGKIYRVPIGEDGEPGEISTVWESQPTDVPDGFAIARSGNLYIPMVGTTAQIAVVAPDGTEIERFPEAPLSGDNGSPIPFDSPSSVMFLGTRLIVANQSALAGDVTHQAILDVEVGEPGLDPLIPDGAGREPGTVVCKVRRIRTGGKRKATGKAISIRDACDVPVKTGKGTFRFRLKRDGRLADRGRVRAASGRVLIRVEGVSPGRYTLIVGKGKDRQRRAVRIKFPL